MARGNIFGKVNVPTTPVKYDGVETETANVVVDNKEKTIAVNVKVDEVVKDCATKEELEVGLNTKQDTLISSENIKTISSHDILGSGDLQLTKEDVGLSNVDNTSDLNKPISTATQSALDLKTNKDDSILKYDVIGSDTSVIGFIDAHPEITGKIIQLNYRPNYQSWWHPYLARLWYNTYGAKYPCFCIYDVGTNRIYYGDTTQVLYFSQMFSDTYLQEFQNLQNKVTSLSSSVTNTQYPSAKAVYDELQLKVSKDSYDSITGDKDFSGWINFNQDGTTKAVRTTQVPTHYNDITPKWYVDNNINLIEITWAQLKNLRDNSQLVPGRFYRITDYYCTTTTTNTSSTSHNFDIIVRADSSNKLNEEASAIRHSGDTYFANNNLSAWKLWYCLDNDTNRFAWADIDFGNGVIYRMIDEFGNDCPYDFKNILFTSSGKYTNAYTFSYTESSVIKDASLLGLNKLCYKNIMKEYINSNNSNKQQLNFNVFYSTTTTLRCYSNIFGNNCYGSIFGVGCYFNTFGSNCYFNTFGNDCYSNTFGNKCYSNTFGNSCHSNIFDNSCYSNVFSDSCHSNILGNNCVSNRFGNSCYSNVFGNDCYSNVFGNNCSRNTFGNEYNNNVFSKSCSYNTFGNGCYSNVFDSNCSSNTFGNYCSSVTFGNNCNFNILGNNCRSVKIENEAGNYAKCNIFENGVSYVSLEGTSIASIDNQIQNVTIHQGVQGTSTSNMKTIIVDRGLSYETNIVPAGTVYTEV